jgi:hypothetical protein
MLFSERSIWTMVHGIGLGGAALLGLAAALFYLYAARPVPDPTGNETGSRAFAMVTVFSAVMLWLTVIIGTYIIGRCGRLCSRCSRWPSFWSQVSRCSVYS